MDPRVQVVIMLMTEDIRRDIPPVELAKRVNLSAPRLRHLFKRGTGNSITKYMKGKRLALARELLETTFLNVNQIMQQVGIRDKSHFSRSFKKYYGLPPLRYRNEYLTKLKASALLQA